MALNANSSLVESGSRGGRALLRFNGSSANVQVWSNSTVSADIATSNSTLDPVLGAKITGVWWSVSGNTISIGRVINATSTNTVLTLSGSGGWSRNDGWMGGIEFPSANLVVTFGTGASGVLFVEVDKEYAGGDFTTEHV